MLLLMRQMMPIGKYAAVYPEFMSVCFGTFGVCIQSTHVYHLAYKKILFISLLSGFIFPM